MMTRDGRSTRIETLDHVTRQEVQLVVAFVDLKYFEAQAQRVTARDLADTIDDYYERVGIEVAKCLWL